ncbi:MAG: HAMP domain-containing sensor histidine kinase [Pseudomonadota bacterium]
MDKLDIVVLDTDEKSELAQKLWLFVGGQNVELRHRKEAKSETVDIRNKIVCINENFYNKNKELCNKINVSNISFYVSQSGEDFDRIGLLSEGFDYVVHGKDIENEHFNKLLNLVISEQKSLQKQQDKREERRYFRDALSVSPDALIIFDENKKIIYASEHYSRVYKSFNDALVEGLHVEEAFALMSQEQDVMPGDPQYQIARDFWYNLDGTSEIALKNGQTLRLTARQLPDSRGTAVTTTNITEYKEQQAVSEEQSKKLEKLLSAEQEASAIQKQFISMVSHEFKTPLTIIDGNAQILSRRSDELTGDIVEKRSKTIRSAVSRLINLMDGVLSSSMIETGNLKYEPEEFDLKALINELCSEQMDLAPTLQIHTDLNNIPDEVSLDKKMMTLIISNLLSNAVKFAHEEPSVEINAEIKNSLLLLQFNDNGIGIPDDEQDKIYDRFYRASNTAGITGTGIGLNLVHQLVQIQGGSIKLVSVEGEGTTFYLTFPLNDE